MEFNENSKRKAIVNEILEVIKECQDRYESEESVFGLSEDYVNAYRNMVSKEVCKRLFLVIERDFNKK